MTLGPSSSVCVVTIWKWKVVGSTSTERKSQLVVIINNRVIKLQINSNDVYCMTKKKEKKNYYINFDISTNCIMLKYPTQNQLTDVEQIQTLSRTCDS